MRKLLLILVCVGLAASVSAVNLTVEVNDEDGNRLNSDIILEQNGGVIRESESFLEAELNSGENYNLTQNIRNRPNVTIRNLSISEDFDFRPTVYDEAPGAGNGFLTDTDYLYYVNQTFEFSKAQIGVNRPEPDRIAKCDKLEKGECQEWVVNDTSDYTNSVDNSLDGGGYQYIVDSFSGYATGNVAPLPVIESIKIFDVTEATDKRENGQLIDEGLNKTFLVDQKNDRQYRFSFNMTNNGSTSWNLDTGDLLTHRGLNASWEVSDIYYDVDGTTQEGGTFQNGNVEWNTGNGGVLNINENLRAEYIVNITQDSTNVFEQVFEVQTTSDTGGKDYHSLEVLKYGMLDATLERPENNTVVQNNREFLMNGTVKCVDGECGEITFEPRRNTSTGQESFTGESFEVIQQNKAGNCSDLVQNQVCDIEWGINATAETNTFHELDFQASSEYGIIDADETQKNTVEVRDVLLMSLDWETIDFGVLDPGERERPAQNNSQGYNLTIDEQSNSVDNLWVKASSLVHDSNNNYSIAPDQLSYAEENNYSKSSQLKESYSLLDTDLSPGATKNLYYWLNVPYGILRGGYSGTVTFKVNSTMQ